MGIAAPGFGDFGKQVFFDSARCSGRRKAEPGGQAKQVGVHRHGRLTEHNIEHNICCLSSHTGKPFKVLAAAGYLAREFLNKHPAQGNDVTGLGGIQVNRLYIFLKALFAQFQHGLGVVGAVKKRAGRLVYAAVCHLGRENDCHKQGVGIAAFQLCGRVGVCRMQAAENFGDLCPVKQCHKRKCNRSAHRRQGGAFTGTLPAMNLLSVSGVSLMGRTEPLFTDISFGLDSGAKTALIGRNGCGKSTLLGCIAGNLAPDSGTIVVNRAAGVSFLPQNPVFRPEDTILTHLFTGGGADLETIRSYEVACEELAAGRGGAAEQLEKLTHEMDSRQLWGWEQRIRAILTSLGIDDLALTMGSLSGGMQKKVALAQVLIEPTGLLLLDEPTNHLDSTTIAWLEDWLLQTDRAVLMVTHDRYFLDSVCTVIHELEYGTLTSYQGNFSRYLELKAEAEAIARRADRRIESVLRTEREWLMRGPKARGTKARARVDAIRAMINRERPREEAGFSFSSAGRRQGGVVMELEGVSKSWPQPDGTSKTVIKNLDLTFRKGQKLGIFGDNGTGKTTLLNILSGNLEPDEGTRRCGDTTAIAYYHQNPDLGNPDGTVLEYIREAAEVIAMADGSTVSAAQLLERFGFSGRVQYSPVAALSGGERKRVYLVRLLISNPNFLILDEPTNDFDIFTLSVLEDFLSGWQGCLVVVSHDRYFMDRVTETLLVLDGAGTVRDFPGSASDWILWKENEKGDESTGANDARGGQSGSSAKGPSAASSAGASKQGAGSAGETKAGSAGAPRPVKLSFKEQKEYEAIEGEIEKLEERKAALEAALSGGETDHRRLSELATELDQTGKDLEAKYARWEYLAGIAGT